MLTTFYEFNESQFEKEAEIETAGMMAPTICNRCEDGIEEEGDPREELAERNTLLEHLRLKRYDLKRKINQLHSPIVRKLPPDVTSTIFEFCLPDYQLSPYTKEDLSIPLSLGAICTYWRDIAWSTPSLWSSLVVCITRECDSHIVMAQEWLTRSGQLPLSIHIFSETDNTTLAALADIINQCSFRWSNLDLYMPPRCYKHFHATDNHAPILKSIRFLSSAKTRKLLNFQLTCPRLDRVSLSYFPIQGTNIQWDNLTHLTLHSVSSTDSFIILRKTPRLVFCKVSGSCPRYRGPRIEALVLTSLRSLQLITRAADSENFLNNLIAPQLEEFSLPNFYNPSMEVIASFLRRSTCSLRSFSMIFSISSPYSGGFINLVQSIPSLETLSIISITDTDLEDTTPEDYDPRNILQLVAVILASQSNEGFLPNLKTLEYTGKLCLRSGNYGDLNSLPSANSAVHGPLHLLKLDLRPATRIPKNMISYLSSLVERGVTVNVLSDSDDILSNSEDAHQSSIDYCRCGKDSLCQDWINNLESSLF